MNKIFILLFLVVVYQGITIAEDKPANYRIEIEAVNIRDNLLVNSNVEGGFISYERIITNSCRYKYRIGYLSKIGCLGNRAKSNAPGILASKLNILPIRRNIDSYYEYGLGLFSSSIEYRNNGERITENATIPVFIVSTGVNFYDSQYVSMGLNLGYLFSGENKKEILDYEIDMSFRGFITGISLHFYF